MSLKRPMPRPRNVLTPLLFARRREHAVRERVGQRRADRQAGVVARHDVGRLREARLVDAADVEQRRHRVDRPAAAQHRLLVQLIRKADPGLEVVHVRVVGPAARCRTANMQAAPDAERARRDLRDRVARVGRLRRRRDRRAAASGSQPRTLRLSRSVGAPSYSQRRPRFSVSLLFTFQSSWMNTPP